MHENLTLRSSINLSIRWFKFVVLWTLFFNLTVLLSSYANSQNLSTQKSCKQIKASFDVGSESTKLNVFKYDLCQKKLIQEVKRYKNQKCSKNIKVSFKSSLKKSENISDSVIDQGISALKQLKNIAEKCGATKFIGVATSAFRQAKNGPQIIEQYAKLGIELKIISQKEEAYLGFLAARFQLDKKASFATPLCVWDIGGSSMQIYCSKDQSKKEREFLEGSYYLGKLGAVPFKEKVLKLKKEININQSIKSIDLSPNPIGKEAYGRSIQFLGQASQSIKESLKQIDLSHAKIIGIGGVHNFAVAKKLGKSTFRVDQIVNLIKINMNLSDIELGSGDYVDTEVTNLILVSEVMKNLDIKEVKTVKVNLNQGASSLY